MPRPCPPGRRPAADALFSTASDNLTHSDSTVQRYARRLFQVLLLPIFAVSLLVAMWIAVAYQIAVERDSALKESVAHTQTLAHTLAEHVTHILRQTDHATQLFKLKYEETHGALRLPEFIRRGGLLDSVLPARLDLPIALIDAHGDVIDRAHAFLPHNVANEAYFRTLAEATDDAPMYSTPVVEPSTKKWQIQVARRLNDGAGEFAGAIVIMIDPDFFIDDYDRLNVDDQGVLVLVARDAGLSIGRVGERLFISDKLDFTPTPDPKRPGEELVVNHPFDRTARIFSGQDLPRFSLVAVVGVSETTGLANFHRQRAMYEWIAVAASLMIVAMFALLMKQSGRLRASMRAAREAQSFLRAAADGSLDAVIILKSWSPNGRAVQDFIVVDINERGAAMVGLPRAELIGQKACEKLPACRTAGFFDRYLAVLESGQALEEEFELGLENQPIRWLHHQIVPIEGGVAITSRDITARKHTELEIRDNRSFLQSLIDHLPLLIYVKSVRADSFGRMVVWNKAAETVTGYPAAQVIGRSAEAAFPPEFGLHDPEADRKMLARPVPLDLPEKLLHCADGSTRYLHAVSVPLKDEVGTTEYILCIAEDVTRRRAQEQELRASQAELSAVTDASPLGLVRADLDGRCTYVNRRFEAITGLTREQALGGGWLGAIHPDDRAMMDTARAHLTSASAPFQAVVRCRHPDGKVIWTSVKIAAIRLGEQIEGFVGSVDDITTLREAELALRESEARLRTIADTLPAMVAYIDADEIYRFHNLAYEREFGRAGLQVHGRTIRETVGEERYATLEPYIRRVLHGEMVIFEEDAARDDHERSLEVTYIPQEGEDGQTIVGFHVMRQDITSQKREKKRLLKLAQVDALTGLTNRAGFMLKLSDAMAQAAAGERLMAVMYMDIDHFKPVNDTFGHNVGDALLKAFSARLTHTLRASDTIARLGGDEFTIIMEKLARAEDASIIAAKIVTAMQAPFELDGVTVSVSASIGLAFYRDGIVSPDALLKQADVLLYQAKQAGRNTYRAAA